MIKEDYVSFEVAELLKEKGLPQQEYMNIFPYYMQNGNLHFGDINTKIQRYYSEAIAITQSLALKWLREVHRIEIHIVLSELHADNNRKYMVDIFSSDINKDYDSIQKDGFNSYEEACEAAIKYSLENLV